MRGITGLTAWASLLPPSPSPPQCLHQEMLMLLIAQFISPGGGREGHLLPPRAWVLSLSANHTEAEEALSAQA